MRERHVPASGSPSAASGVDLLSEVLASVRLTGAMLFVVDATAPWKSWAPAAEAFRPVTLPHAEHLISYHLVTEGGCWAGLLGQPAERLEPGDVLVVPHGDAYFLADPADAAPSYDGAQAVQFFSRMAAGELPASVTQDGGRGARRAEFICGFLGCSRRPFNPVLAALPPMVVLRASAQSSQRLRPLVEFALVEMRARSAGGQAVLTRLAELMFVELLRCHLGALAAAGGGWLAGLRDPLVARALASLHAAPRSRWTIGALASRCGVSRSVLAERFTQLVGLPPMRYLAQWRIQLAARLLEQPGRIKLGVVAEAVGYESEAAFSRAFKRSAGAAPAAWRARSGH